MAAVLPTAQGLEDSVATQAVVQLLQWIGERPEREGLLDTPQRVARALREMTRGYHDDPKQILSTTFEVAYDQMVVLREVRFQSLCEHHMLPFMGTASVGYLPRDRVVGLSKLARLVRCYAHRLQVQERMTTEIAEAIAKHLECLGVGVVVRARHSCMGHRGIRQPDAEMVTSAMLGVFRDNSGTRAEFLELIR